MKKQLILCIYLLQSAALFGASAAYTELTSKTGTLKPLALIYAEKLKEEVEKTAGAITNNLKQVADKIIEAETKRINDLYKKDPIAQAKAYQTLKEKIDRLYAGSEYWEMQLVQVNERATNLIQKTQKTEHYTLPHELEEETIRLVDADDNEVGTVSRAEARSRAEAGAYSFIPLSDEPDTDSTQAEDGTALSPAPRYKLVRQPLHQLIIEYCKLLEVQKWIEDDLKSGFTTAKDTFVSRGTEIQDALEYYNHPGNNFNKRTVAKALPYAEEALAPLIKDITETTVTRGKLLQEELVPAYGLTPGNIRTQKLGEAWNSYKGLIGLGAVVASGVIFIQDAVKVAATVVVQTLGQSAAKVVVPVVEGQANKGQRELDKLYNHYAGRPIKTSFEPVGKFNPHAAPKAMLETASYKAARADLLKKVAEPLHKASIGHPNPFEGQPHCFLITGRSGSGKSELVKEFIKLMQQAYKDEIIILQPGPNDPLIQKFSAIGDFLLGAYAAEKKPIIAIVEEAHLAKTTTGNGSASSNLLDQTDKINSSSAPVFFVSISNEFDAFSKAELRAGRREVIHVGDSLLKDRELFFAHLALTPEQLRACAIRTQGASNADLEKINQEAEAMVPRTGTGVTIKEINRSISSHMFQLTRGYESLSATTQDLIAAAYAGAAYVEVAQQAASPTGAIDSYIFASSSARRIGANVEYGIVDVRTADDGEPLETTARLTTAVRRLLAEKIAQQHLVKTHDHARANKNISVASEICLKMVLDGYNLSQLPTTIQDAKRMKAFELMEKTEKALLQEFASTPNRVFVDAIFKRLRKGEDLGQEELSAEWSARTAKPAAQPTITTRTPAPDGEAPEPALSLALKK